jgi:hypothetical protein
MDIFGKRAGNRTGRHCGRTDSFYKLPACHSCFFFLLCHGVPPFFGVTHFTTFPLSIGYFFYTSFDVEDYRKLGLPEQTPHQAPRLRLEISIPPGREKYRVLFEA